METTRAILKLSCECPYCETPHGLVRLHETERLYLINGEQVVETKVCRKCKKEFGVKPVWEASPP